ncbi:MAG: SurA N-terminal domain-containing protein, partial [Bacteroidales bacterium]|nr:SurA N-terminal domain-containing protein [Bacteroidales bacterium]
MAAIGQIRKHSGLIILIVGIALAAFVLGDFLKPSSSRPRQVVGVVDGEEISTIVFENKVNERIEATKNQRQTDKLSPQDIYQIRQGIWNEMIEDILLAEEFEKLGLTVTPDELSDQILGDRPHQYVTQSFTNPNTGSFDRDMLRNFLQNLDNADPEMRKRYLNLEALVKNDRRKTKYKNLISMAYFVPDQFAKLDYKYKNSTANIRYVAARFTSVADSSVNISDIDLKKYYDENLYKYSQEETRSIDYVIFEVQPSSDDRKKIANTVNQLYKEFKDISEVSVFINSTSDDKYDSTYKKEAELPARIAKEMFESPVGTMVGPYVENETYYISKLIDREERSDSLNLSQLLITYATAPAAAGISDRTKEDAEALVDSLFAVIQQNPSKFEDMVVGFSDFPSAADDKGEMGWVIDGTPGYGTYYNNAYNMNTGE